MLGSRWWRRGCGTISDQHYVALWKSNVVPKLKQQLGIKRSKWIWWYINYLWFHNSFSEIVRIFLLSIEKMQVNLSMIQHWLPLTGDRSNLDSVKMVKGNKYRQILEWTLRSFTNRVHQYGADGMLFVEVSYDLKFTRKPAYYITSFMWPAFIITCMSIIGIFTPYTEMGQRVEKVTFGLTALLTMAIVLMIITGEMPKSSNGIPLLGEHILFNLLCLSSIISGIFVIIEIILIAIATLFSVMNLHLHKTYMSGKRVPNCLLAITCMSKMKTPKAAARSTSAYSGGIRVSNRSFDYFPPYSCLT